MKHNFTDSKWGKEPPTFQSAVKSLNNSDGRMDHTCLNKSTNQKVFLFVFFLTGKKENTQHQSFKVLTSHFFSYLLNIFF